MKRLRLAVAGLLVSACNYTGPLTMNPYGSDYRSDYYYGGDDSYAYTPPASATGPQPDYGDLVQAPSPPPPIVGGTLTILSDNTTAVAADPDRDHVFIVDLRQKRTIADIPVDAGMLPSRSVEDGAHRVHVVLKNGGGILTTEAPWTTSVRRDVCPLPRGIAYRRATDELIVACQGGELVMLPAETGAPTKIVKLSQDLRDVVVLGDRLLVSSLKTAEVTTLAADGTVLTTTRPPAYDLGGNFVPSSGVRLVAARDSNAAFFLHQRAYSDDVATRGTTNYYGGQDACIDPIVHSALTVVEPGKEPVAAPVVPDAIVPVDVAASPANAVLAVVAPGNAFTKSLPTLLLLHRAFTAARDEVPGTPTDPCEYPEIAINAGQATAVAYDSIGNLYVQTREPAEIVKVADDELRPVVTLSTESRHDTGHAVFYSNAGANIACASCHVEGAEDGHVWRFIEGQRRTPSLQGGISGTEPFHWGGDQSTFTALEREVFEKRMGGPALSEPQINATVRWVDAIPKAPARPVSDPDAVARGKILFEGTAQCTSCHNGERLTNNGTLDVGTGGSYQVPSLIGLGWRPPFLHHGKAATLTARFGAAGGGDKHGKTSKLDSVQLADLVAYLESL